MEMRSLRSAPLLSNGDPPGQLYTEPKKPGNAAVAVWRPNGRKVPARVRLETLGATGVWPIASLNFTRVVMCVCVPAPWGH